MGTRRRFSNRLKRQVVEEYLAGVSTQAQLARRYDISPHLIIQWRKRYSEGKLERENDLESLAKEARIRELERLVGKLALENELLKKAAEFVEQRERESSSIATGPGLVPFKRDARS